MDRSKWEYKKLGDISVFLTGCRPKGGVAQIKEGVHSLGGEHIGKDGYVDLSSPKFVPESFFINNKGHIKDNDILLCKDGALSGKVAIVRGELNDTKAMVNEHVFIIRSDSLLHKYLFYYLFSPTGQYQLKLRISGAAQGGINGANLSTIIVPYPKDVSLQQRIVAELDCLNEMIALKQEQLKEFDKLAQSIFYDMFGDKDFPTYQLKDVLSKMGSGATPSGGNQSYKTEGISLIRSLNVHNNEFVYKDLAFIDEQQAKQLNNVTIEENDVLLNITGASVARCCVVPNDVLPARVNQHVSILRPRTKLLDSLFLCHYLISCEEQAKLLSLSKSKAATREALPKNLLEKYMIKLPPLALQQQFAEKIQAIEVQKELVKKSIAETQHLLDSRMDFYFD